MTTVLAIEKEISSFQVLHNHLGLTRAEDESFFQEWQNLSRNPDSGDRAFLDRLQTRYRYYYEAGILTEGTVLLSIVAPLLDHLGFHEPPFLVRSEVGLEIAVQERDEVYRGRMDVLVTGKRFWVVVVEAKRAKFAADLALPQCLAYMSSSGQPVTFGLVTNGSDFLFCKLEGAVYDFSEPFSLLSRHNRLVEVAEVLERLKRLSL